MKQSVDKEKSDELRVRHVVFFCLTLGNEWTNNYLATFVTTLIGENVWSVVLVAKLLVHRLRPRLADKGKGDFPGRQDMLVSGIKRKLHRFLPCHVANIKRAHIKTSIAQKSRPFGRLFCSTSFRGPCERLDQSCRALPARCRS